MLSPIAPFLARPTAKPRLAFLGAAALAALVSVALLPPIPQDPAYHVFADNRPLLGLPNAGNVLSNAAFIIAGLVGLRRLAGQPASPLLGRWRFFYAAIAFVGLGSGYYHWSPTSDSLFWDRLPMTLGFTALTVCLVADRLGARFERLFWPLVITGAASILYWRLSELAGAGDLRPYILVQFLPMALVPLILLLFPRDRAADRQWWLLLAGYVLAKGLEMQDAAVYTLTGHLMSGHMLKHLAAAGAILLFRPPLLNDTGDGK